VENALDAILEATRQVPGDQWATARYALADAVGDEPAAHCEGVLDDQGGVHGAMESVGEFDLRFRYEQHGRHLTIQTSHRELEKVAPIRDVLRRWSSEPS
jgi:hypothetical protein